MSLDKLETNSENIYNDDLSLRELFIVLWNGKLTITLITIIAAIISLYSALSQPNYYTSNILLSPANSSGANSSGLSQYSGIASLAGISIPSTGGNDVTLGLEILSSREFITNFINRKDILVPLFATKSWNELTGESTIDDQIYDVESKKWLGGPSSTPTNQEAYEVFSNMLGINENKKTGFVLVSIVNQSQVLAQQWVTWLIEDLNDHMRDRMINEASRSIKFLEDKIKFTDLSELRSMLAKMIQEQTKTVMLGNVRPEYLLNIIDPAIVPERKTGPGRAMICILGTFTGLIMACLLVFLRYFGPEMVRKHQDVSL